MYDTAAVLSVRTNTCLPNSSGRNCRKARCTASSSRQLMCQSRRGPVQSPEAACPLHVAPQPVLEASVVTTTCRDTCSKGTPARRKARSVQGLKERRHSCVIFTRIRAAWLQLRMPYAPGASETVSVEPQSCLWRNSGSSALIGRALPWGAPSYSPSLTPHQEKRFSAQGRACSFPSWPEAPTGWGAEAPDPCDRTTVLGTGPEWASRRDSWGSWRPLPVTGQGRPLRPSWRHGKRGRARRGGPCTATPDLRTQTVGTVCVGEGSKHESKHPSGRSLQTNPGAVCIWSYACASTSWTGACAGPGSGVANPGLVEDHRLSWVRWSLFLLLLPIPVSTSWP